MEKTNVFSAHRKKNIGNKEKRKVELCRSREKVWNERKSDVKNLFRDYSP